MNLILSCSLHLSVACLHEEVPHFYLYLPDILAGIAPSVLGLAMDWTVRGSNPGGGKIFRTIPDRPWDLASLLYNEYRVFPEGKTAGSWR